MTVYFRSADLVITEKLIRVRVPYGWQVWVVADLRDFGQVRHEPPADRRSWGLGAPALVLVFVAWPVGGWVLPAAVLLLVAACVWYAADCRDARRRASSQLWASHRARAVMVFERPDREFDAACRALRRVLDRLEDEGHS
ncbi:DUF6232 family protein [Actinoplanes sp. NPDC051513]|uniref:DUF6232 family protein n=1 Tax=Actinoplanes sp. NPDC051513 TaxID=3363908 RepID=UPI0037ACF1EA